MGEVFDLSVFDKPLPVPKDEEAEAEEFWLKRQPFIKDTPTERAVFRGGPYDGTEQIVTTTLSEVIVDGSMTDKALRTGDIDWPGHYIYRRTTHAIRIPGPRDPHFTPKMAEFKYVGPTEKLEDPPEDMVDPPIPASEFPSQQEWGDDD
jgi:hypothetical protein